MTQKNTNSGFGLNKLSFFTIGAAAILYLVSAIFTLIDINSLVTIARLLSGIATAIMVCIVSVLAWKYARHKTTAWKVLYFVFLAIVVLGIVIPLIKG